VHSFASAMFLRARIPGRIPTQTLRRGLFDSITRVGRNEYEPSVVMERIAETSPRTLARVAGAISLVAMLMGVASQFFARDWLGSAAFVIATLCNILATLLFYLIFKPVNRSLSLLAVFFGLSVSIIGILKWHPHGVDIGLIFFGSYCLLIGYLVFRSAFLPRILGALMAIAGLSWLTFLFPPLADRLSPYNLAVGVLGQGTLTLWLLVVGVNVQRWGKQASV
jgi:hypothetical protein